jgi:hypothetical protein
MIAAHQRLNTERFRGAEDAVPTGRVPAIVLGGGHQYRAATRVNALQQGGEIFAADLAGEAKADRSLADPLPYTGLSLRIVVVLAVMLLEVTLGLAAVERAG